MNAKLRQLNQRSGFVLLSIISAGFLVAAMTVHPAELPKQPVKAACTINQSA
ncbi:hypothetical protein [Lacisediminimonas profundi]|uniref:hypothetical protein n=1 Tax=Lacisediminimonas profundi TaxID=2603856 RepID=UPI0013868BC6|nr:hypothetical protein [Lacisediminimonas profundi]